MGKSQNKLGTRHSETNTFIEGEEFHCMELKMNITGKVR